MRSVVERALRPLVRGTIARISPHIVTVAAFIVGMGTVWSIATGRSRWLSLGLWLISRTLDGLDGVISRRSGRSSDFGGYLDMMLDVLVYSAIPIALTIRQGQISWALVGLLTVFYINATSWMYLSAILEKRGQVARRASRYTAIVMPRGLIEGSETIAIYALMIVWPTGMQLLFWTMASLTLVGVFQRGWWALKNLRH